PDRLAQPAQSAALQLHDAINLSKEVHGGAILAERRVARETAQRRAGPVGEQPGRAPPSSSRPRRLGCRLSRSVRAPRSPPPAYILTTLGKVKERGRQEERTQVRWRAARMRSATSRTAPSPPFFLQT